MKIRLVAPKHYLSLFSKTMADVPAAAQGPAQNIQADPDVSSNARWRLATKLTDAYPSSSVNQTPVLGMICVCALVVSV